MDREKEVNVNVEDLALESSEMKETRSLALEYQDKFQLLEAKLAKISQEIVDLRTEKVTVTDLRSKSEIERLNLVEKLKTSQDKELKDQSQSLVVEYQVKIQELEAKVAKLSQENVDLRIEKAMITEDLMRKRLECDQLAQERMQKRLESDQLAEELRSNNLEAIKTERGFRLKALESSTHGLTSAVAREVQNVYLLVSEGVKDWRGHGENAGSLGSLVLPNRGGSNSIGPFTGSILSSSRVHLESYNVFQDDRHKGSQDSGMSTELKVENVSETELTSLTAAPLAVNPPNLGDQGVRQKANKRPSTPSRAIEELKRVRAGLEKYNVDLGKPLNEMDRLDYLQDEHSSQGVDESHNTNDGNGEEVPHPKGPKRRKVSHPSLMWLHFTKLPPIDGVFWKAMCNYCTKKVGCHPRQHGTSSMRSHLNGCTKYRSNQSTLDGKQSQLTHD